MHFLRLQIFTIFCRFSIPLLYRTPAPLFEASYYSPLGFTLNPSLSALPTQLLVILQYNVFAFFSHPSQPPDGFILHFLTSPCMTPSIEHISTNTTKNTTFKFHIYYLAKIQTIQTPPLSATTPTTSWPPPQLLLCSSGPPPATPLPRHEPGSTGFVTPNPP